jgi:hypothetical protein
VILSDLPSGARTGAGATTASAFTAGRNLAREHAPEARSGVVRMAPSWVTCLITTRRVRQPPAHPFHPLKEYRECPVLPCLVVPWCERRGVGASLRDRALILRTKPICVVLALRVSPDLRGADEYASASAGCGGGQKATRNRRVAGVTVGLHARLCAEGCKERSGNCILEKAAAKCQVSQDRPATLPMRLAPQ